MKEAYVVRSFIVFYALLSTLLAYGVLFEDRWLSYSGLNPAEKKEREQRGQYWEQFGFLVPWFAALVGAVVLTLVPLKVQHGRGKRVTIESLLE